MTVPILLITGFLGAGKTSFINEMLRDAGGLRIAAVVNDFGSINIDAALLETATDDVIGLKNGCICCSLQGDLLRTLRQILQESDPQLIVIEASGIADPQGIVAALMDPILWQATTLDTILCIVDTEDLSTTPERWQDPLWQAQIASADIIQLSKVTPERAGLAPLTARLAAMGKPAVFGQDGCTLAVRDLIGRSTPRRDPGQRPLIDSGRFTSLEWSSGGPVSMPRFQRLIGTLSDQLLRAKGFLTLHEKPGEHLLFQLVGRRASLAPSDQRQQGCQLVLIGEKTDFDPITVEQRLNTELLTTPG